MRTKATFAALALLFCLSLAKSVQADPIVLTITNPNQSGTPGTLLVFNATYTNPGTLPFMITGENFNDSVFFNVGPLTSLRPLGLIIPAQSTVATPIFSVLIAATTAPGVYSFTVFSDGFNPPNGPLEVSNTVSFSITVLPPSEVPEPATLLLLVTGLSGVVAVARKRARDR